MMSMLFSMAVLVNTLNGPQQPTRSAENAIDYATLSQDRPKIPPSPPSPTDVVEDNRIPPAPLRAPIPDTAALEAKKFMWYGCLLEGALNVDPAFDDLESDQILEMVESRCKPHMAVDLEIYDSYSFERLRPVLNVALSIARNKIKDQK